MIDTCILASPFTDSDRGFIEITEQNVDLCTILFCMENGIFNLF